MELSQFYGFIPFLASAVLTILVGLTFKAIRKRMLRRSPLAEKKIGHIPGQQLVERMNHHDSEVMNGIMFMFIAFPIMFMLWAGQKVDWSNQRLGTIEWIFFAGALLFFAYGFRDYRRHFIAREKARDGLLAERVTGMQLNRLVAHGCLVMHDVPSETGNIDHVVIAPRGVYAVETKSFRKPRHAAQDRNGTGHQVQFDGSGLRFPDFNTRKPIDQASKHADWLRRYLRETIKLDVPVIASVALPGWYVVQTEEVWRTSHVKVFTPLGDGANFMAKELLRIDAAHRSLVATALAQRYPITTD